MASRYEVEVTILSAKDIKNVNWRYGRNRPYAVVWVDPRNKSSTKVDEEGDTCPVWDEKLLIPLPPGTSIDDAELHVDVVHAGPEEDTKPLIGSAKIKLREILEEGGMNSQVRKTVKFKRPSGRPHGKLDVEIQIRDPYRYPQPRAYDAPPYGVPPPSQYGSPYTAPPSGYPYDSGAPPQGGYPYSQPQGYGQPAGYGQGYGQPAGYGQGYGQPAGYGQGYEEEKKKKGMGMGTGVAMGVGAGLLGGVALAVGAEALEDHIEDEAAEKVEEDLGYDEGDYGGDDE